MIGKTVRARRRNSAALGVLMALLVLIGAGATWLFNRAPEQREPRTVAVAPIKSMAVLPLDNISNNPADDFLSVAMTDALVTKLQQIPSMQVRPTSAVLEFRDKKADARTVREALKVDGVLEGRFLTAGDLVRVNLQLTDSRTGYSVWADSVDGKRQDLLKLIDDVSARTMTALNQKLGVREAPQRSEARSSNPKAYEEYLKARALTASLASAEHAAQIAALRRAVELDPNFAAAYADLAIALSVGRARGLHDDPDTIKMAEWYARQAVRLDPNLPQSHLALGRVFVRFPDRFPESIRESLAALRLAPNESGALHALTTYYVSTGELQKAQCAGDRLVSIDPASSEARIRGYWNINAVDAEGALRTAKFALDSKDTELAGHDILANAYLILGNLPAAEAEQKKISALVPRHYLGKSLRAMIAAARGDRIATAYAIHSFEDEANRNHWAALRVTLCYAKLGDQTNALTWMQRTADLGNHNWCTLIKHPWLQSMQGNPDYQKIVAKIKLDLDDVRDDAAGVYQLICPGR